MNIGKTEFFMITIIIIGAILLAWGITELSNTIEQDGLKSIINEIWCGEKGCE